MSQVDELPTKPFFSSRAMWGWIVTIGTILFRLTTDPEIPPLVLEAVQLAGALIGVIGTIRRKTVLTLTAPDGQDV